jgi:hypothetical protein
MVCAMPTRRKFVHKKRRYHRHPHALGHPDAGKEDSERVSRTGMLVAAGVLFFAAAPFAMAFLMTLLLGPVNTQQWLQSVNADWLAPWLR